MPRLVLLTRHAEKPDDPSDPNLSPAGKQRAKTCQLHSTGFWEDSFLVRLSAFETQCATDRDHHTVVRVYRRAN